MKAAWTKSLVVVAATMGVLLFSQSSRADDCRRACGLAKGGCMFNARNVFRDCRDVCNGDAACIAACKGNFLLAKGDCIAAKDACHQDCLTAAQECARACGATAKGCFQTVRQTARDCRTACRTTARADRDACKANNPDPGACLDAVGAQQSACLDGCGVTQAAGYESCGLAFGTCMATCRPEEPAP